MAFYRDRILPHLIKHAMRGKNLVPYRERVVEAAAGRVLEIGIGSGENLSRYGAAVVEVIGIEPATRLAAMAREAARRVATPARIVEATAEKIPLDARSIDTVVLTWTLCSVPDPVAALHEIGRVVRADGRLLFVEHGLAPDAGVRNWQRRITPLWQRLAGGCHLDRDVRSLIQRSGFHLEHLETGYAGGPKPMSYMYEGSARLE